MPEKTETEGSSAATAWAVGTGAVAGAILLGPIAAVVLPVVGIAGAAAAITAPVGALIGGFLGYGAGGKK